MAPPPTPPGRGCKIARFFPPSLLLFPYVFPIWLRICYLEPLQVNHIFFPGLCGGRPSTVNRLARQPPLPPWPAFFPPFSCRAPGLLSRSKQCVISSPPGPFSSATVPLFAFFGVGCKPAVLRRSCPFKFSPFLVHPPLFPNSL